jgi:hypothetical protein
MTRTAALSACLAALCLAAPPAQAAAPPTGRYDCKFTDSNRTAGFIKIVSASKYSYNGKKSGKYSTSGKNITFKSGPYKGLYKHAVWKRNAGLTYISLYDGPTYGQSSTDEQCIRRKS